MLFLSSAVFFFKINFFKEFSQLYHQSVKIFMILSKLFAKAITQPCMPIYTLVNVYVDLVVFTRIAGTS